ncbi:MAG: hypothetical protein R6X18_04265 [Chloroflexota bacterium]|jgi:hypothetical protein
MSDNAQDTCENCGRPVLPSDVTCWHCGYTLPGRPKSRAASGTGASSTARLFGAGRQSNDETEEAGEYNFRAIALYGTLTLFVIISLGFVLSALGQYPTLVRSANLVLGSDWIAVTDADLRYTISLPNSWQWLDLAYRDQGLMLPQLIARQPYIDRALRPLGDAAGDVEILGIAVNALTLEDVDPRPFVVIARSERLRSLSPQAALDELIDYSLPVSDQSINRRLAGQPQARYNVLDLEQAYQCRHLFITGSESAGYLVAACAPQARFAIIQRELNNILDSFQLIQR